MRSLLLSLILLLGVAFASAPEGEAVRKPSQNLKTLVGEAPPVLESIPDAVAPVWQLLQKTDRRSRAFLIGDRARLESGAIEADDFVPVYPPDVLASLGLATVYQPDTAGWYVIAGRRVHVRTTDAERQYVTLSYESMARVAWGVGIASDTLASARILYDSGMHLPRALGDVLEQAVSEAPATGAWIVAGHARFALLRGRALRRPPIDGRVLERPENLSERTDMLFAPVAERAQSALIVAVVVDTRSTASEAATTLDKRFFADLPEERFGPYRVRIHYAAFHPPAPLIDAGLPFQAMWNDPRPGDELPRVRVVRQGFPDSTVRRAHLSVFAIDSVGPFDLYPEPEFVDVTSLDPTLLTEQKWASNATFVGEPIYKKPRLVLRRPVAEAIVRINARLREKGLQLKLYDGYRPLSVTQRLWKLRPDRRYLAVPNIGSRHNRGAAVDLTLADSDGKELEMPSEYLTFDARSHRDYEGMSETARANMERLTRVMASEGFTGINEEWWHYDAPGWKHYRVADVPLWPEEKATTATAVAPPPDIGVPPARLTTQTLATTATLRPAATATPAPAPMTAPLVPGTNRPITGLEPPPFIERYPIVPIALAFVAGIAVALVLTVALRRK